MGSISESKDFSGFCANLRLSNSSVSTIQKRYHAITRRINQDFWNTDSENTHSLYVGSYGRGTCIYTSDVDIVVELPWSIYRKFADYSGNGQSALLQALRNSLMKTYVSSSISADGQVVDIDFHDGIKFEVVPAFKHLDNSGYCYPDTNNGGRWKNMNPTAEISYFNMCNLKSNKNLKRLCRMIRAWNNQHSVLMSGILIDTIAYAFIQDYKYADKSFSYYDWMSRDFFKYLLDHADQEYWLKPGSKERVYKKYSFKTAAEKAYNKCLEAIGDYRNDYVYCWHQDWREIYGYKFPSQ